MKSNLLILLLGACTSLLVSCGSTSKVKSVEGASAKTYSRVIVNDFTHSVSDYKVKSKVNMATKTLPDAIAGELEATGAFTSIARKGKADASTLVIGGNISDYDDGNAAMRLLVGFAAGNSNLNGTIQYRDGATGKLIGSQKADKNSWALGGMLAANQDAESFIEPVAKKVAAEAAAKYSLKAAN